MNGQLLVTGAAGDVITVDHSAGDTGISGSGLNATFFDDGLLPNGILIKTAARDTVNVLGEGVATKIDGQGQAGLSVNVGKNGHLDGVLGDLSIINAQGLASLNVDDSADTTTRKVTLNTANGGSQGVIAVSGVQTIFYPNFGGTLTFSGGPGNGTDFNTYTVQDTVALAKTILNTGTGKSTTVIQGTTGALTVNCQGSLGQGFFQQVGVGLNDSVQSIKGTVTAISTGGPFELFVSDAAGPAAPNVTMGVNAQQLGFISGLAQATIFYAANDIEALNVLGPQTATTYTITDTASNNNFPVAVGTGVIGGNGNNTFNVQKTSGSLGLLGGKGNGNNIFNIGSTTNTLGTIQGRVDVNGGGGFGTVTLNVNDQGTTTPQTYTLSFDKDEFNKDEKDESKLLASDAPNGIFFRNIRNANLNAGGGNNTINRAAGP
jgi:hypothetical protein